MQNEHSVDDLLEFLSHTGDRGLMPTATATALAVAVRNVFSVLDESERANLPLDDLDGIIRRFNIKRARDFNPASLKEYGRRVKRAVDMYLKWKEDPANFSVKTRATNTTKKKNRTAAKETVSSTVKPPSDDSEHVLVATSASGPQISPDSGYQTAFPVRQGQIVTVSNIPHDFSPAEAERLAEFIRLLAHP